VEAPTMQNDSVVRVCVCVCV